jgi:intein/homing endonuclease
MPKYNEPYFPIVKMKGFNPSPVAGRIPPFADSEANTLVRGTRLFTEWWGEQIDRCVNGYRTGGLDITGRHYFYLNFVPIDGLFGKQYPWFVDLDYGFFKDVEIVKKNHMMGLITLKARRKGLSEKVQGGILQYGLRFIEGYRGAVTAGLETYVKGLRAKFMKTSAGIHKEMRLNVLIDNDEEYKIGYERKDNVGGWIEDGYKGHISFRTMYDNPKKLEGEYFHDVICEESGEFMRLYDTIDSIMPALEFGSEMLGCFFIHGCVCAGTKVWDNKGNLINIEDLKQSDGILGFNGSSISKENITYMQSPAKKECYRISTNTGRVLECSEDHPILWSRKNYLRGPHDNLKKAVRFVIAKNIKIGDQIAVIEEVPIYGDKKMWEPRFTGWLIGDGSYGFDKTPVLSNCDNEINNYVLKRFDCLIERSHFTKDLKVYQDTRIKNICGELRNLGIYGQTKTHKRLPILIHSYRKNDICELLGGLFDTDGSVNAKKGGYKIVLVASGFELLSEVQFLLQKLGIHCNIHKAKASPNSGKGGINGCYRLCICDKRSIIKFSNEISFKIKYKQDNLDRITYWLNHKSPVIRKGKETIIRKGVKGLRFERVVSAEPIGLKQIYNLSAGITNTYIANGIVTHNTGGNILTLSKDFSELYNNAEQYNLLRRFIPGSRLYFPFFVNKIRTTAKDKDTGEEINGIPNLSSAGYKPFQMHGMEDLVAAESHILHKRKIFASLPDKTKLKKLNKNYCLTEEEAFTSGGRNDFNDEILYNTLYNLEVEGLKYKPYILEWAIEEIEGVLKQKQPPEVSCRPAKESDPSWKIVWIYQMPRKDYADLDVMGIDSYNQDQTRTSYSLGATVVVRRGNWLNLIEEGIHNAEYPICLYYQRPPRKEIFYDISLMIAVMYGCKRNVMINAEQDFCIDYFKKNGGMAYLSRRPKKFDAPNSRQVHDYGAKMTGSSKPVILAVLQTFIEDFGMYIVFPPMLRDLIAYDEEFIGTDWDSADALAYAKMRIEDMKASPRNVAKTDQLDEAPIWVPDRDGNMILKNAERLERKQPKIQKEEGGGGWKGFR